MRRAVGRRSFCDSSWRADSCRDRRHSRTLARCWDPPAAAFRHTALRRTLSKYRQHSAQQLEMGKNPKFCVRVRFEFCKRWVRIRFGSGSSLMGVEKRFRGGHLLWINCNCKYQLID